MPQITEHLGEVNAQQFVDCLYFDDDGLLDNQVQPLDRRERFAFVRQWNDDLS